MIDMKCFPEKIIGFLVSTILVNIVLVVMLAIISQQLDSLISLSQFKEVRTEFHVSNLKCDTIHASEIEIFPLMDLEGNVIQ